MFDWLSKIIGGVGDYFSERMDTVANGVSYMIWDSMLTWFYTAIYAAIAQFFTLMGNFGVEMYDLAWVKSALHLFHLFGWALFTVGMVVAIFDVAIEAQSGRVNIKTTALNILKGFLAASLVTVLPLEIYKFSVTLQNTFSGDLIRIFTGQQNLTLSTAGMNALSGAFAVTAQGSMSVFNMLAMIAFAYAMIKVFFYNIKRGGILLIQMAVGTLYLFSVPRGYTDGFNSWCKQIVALCLTAFLQTTLLFMGLMTFSTHMLLGLGIMLSANEVPRIAQQFGLDTGAKINAMNIVHATTTAVNLGRNMTKVVAK